MRAAHDDYTISWHEDASHMTEAHWQQLALAGRFSLALLAFSLPYEAVLFRAGSLEITNLELLVAAVLFFASVLILGQKRWRQAGWLRFPRAWLLLWALLALGLFASTSLAPEHRLNAAKASARLLYGMLLALAVPQLIPRRADVSRSLLRWLALPLLLGGLPAILAGLWEVWRRQGLSWLSAFRDVPTMVGPFIRLTGPFDHANQAAMYLEATVPFVLAVAVIAYRHARPLLPLALIAILLWLQAVISTYGRTALVAIIAGAALVAILLAARHLIRLRRQRDARFTSEHLRASLPWLALALTLAVMVVLNAAVDPVMRMRFRTEGDNEWYNLAFDAPAALQVEAGHTITTTITVQNQGDLTWASAPPTVIYLGGHWYLPGEEDALAYTPRWPLPHAVAPGESLTMQVALQAPLQEGDYHFRWDMLHEGSTWFSYKNGVRTRTLVTVEEASAPPPAVAEPALGQIVEAPPDLAPIPARRELWRIAAQELSRRPLLGIGLDNYRLVYGRALDYEEWNDTIHTNNWYIEILVSLGLLGALPYLVWLALLALSLLRTLLRPRVTLWHAALAVALFTFMLHGLLDYFLATNSAGLLFWLVNGWWVVLESHSPRVV